VTDVRTIPASVARQVAEFIRAAIDGEESITTRLAMKRAADLLDPKTPTLRDEVAADCQTRSMCAGGDEPCHRCYSHADAVLAVVKARIEAACQGKGSDAEALRAVYALFEESS
jgi:hypothetical protein